MTPKRILSIDFGEKRIGLALSDSLGIIAQGLETYRRRSPAEDFQFISKLCDEKGVEECVVGLPLNMKGEEGPQAKIVLSWTEELRKKISVPVKTWDERLTSKEANRILIQGGLSRKEQKEKSDFVSAVIILQNYLEYLRRDEWKEFEP